MSSERKRVLRARAPATKPRRAAKPSRSSDDDAHLEVSRDTPLPAPGRQLEVAVRSPRAPVVGTRYRAAATMIGVLELDWDGRAPSVTLRLLSWTPPATGRRSGTARFAVQTVPRAAADGALPSLQLLRTTRLHAVPAPAPLVTASKATSVAAPVADPVAAGVGEPLRRWEHAVVIQETVVLPEEPFITLAVRDDYGRLERMFTAVELRHPRSGDIVARGEVVDVGRRSRVLLIRTRRRRFRLRIRAGTEVRPLRRDDRDRRDWERDLDDRDWLENDHDERGFEEDDRRREPLRHSTPPAARST